MEDIGKKTSSDLDDILSRLSDLKLHQESLKDLKKAQKQMNDKINSAIATIRENKAQEIAQIIKEHQITAQMMIKALGDDAGELGYSSAPTPKQKEQKKAPAPKFRSPDGRTWTGFGRNPKWMGERGSSEYKENERRYLIQPDGSTKYEREKKEGSAEGLD